MSTTLKRMDIEELHQKYQNCRARVPEFKRVPSEEDVAKWRDRLVQSVREGKPIQKPKGMPSAFLLRVVRRLREEGVLTLAEESRLEEQLRVARGKSHSGVLVITVFTSPTPTYEDPETGKTVVQRFSCQWNCYYCPNQPGQPRSYLEGEPGVMRANQYNFDPVAQMHGRMNDLYDAGHPVDKLEVLVLGGTWESYPELYREAFVRDLYYAANTFHTAPRPKESLEVEKTEQNHSASKLIGLTIETRPDTITPASLAVLRRYGCTRVQLGIQHLDDGILKGIHRCCTRAQIEHAIALLKSWGFKLDGHFMPNLPGSSPALDRWMLVEQLLGQERPIEHVEPSVPGVDHWERWSVTHPEIQMDQWKVYPCETTPYTVIEKWYREGRYRPYPEEDLVPVMLEMKTSVFPWIRLNRIVRDIPSDYIVATGDRPNLRQVLLDRLRATGQRCRCIRCREVKQGSYRPDKSQWYVREYLNTWGTDYFISCESPDATVLYGFVRLYLPIDSNASPSGPNRNNAWVRELHVYGQIQKTTPVIEKPETVIHPTQHRGIGKTLMLLAETIAHSKGNKKELWVIAGEGTKGYYRRLGYTDAPYGYMRKGLDAMQI